MHDTAFYQQFLNTPFGFICLLLLGIGVNVFVCWFLCKWGDKQKTAK